MSLTLHRARSLCGRPLAWKVLATRADYYNSATDLHARTQGIPTPSGKESLERNASAPHTLGRGLFPHHLSVTYL